MIAKSIDVAMDKNLDWKLSADWLTPQKKEAVRTKLCVVRTASTNELRCKNRVNQSAVRKYPSGGLI